MRPNIVVAAFTLFLVAFAAPASAVPAAAPADGEPRSLRAERLLDRAWLRERGIEAPTRLAFDDAGGLYVLDTSARRVIRLPLESAEVDRYGETAADRYGEESVASWIPADLALDLRGSLLVLDRASGSVVAYARRGEALGERELDPALQDEARAAGARLLRDPYGELWLLAPRERDLVSLDARLRRRRTGRYLVPEESLDGPVAAAFLPRGGGWIADAGRGVLRRFDTTGHLSTVARAPDSIAFRPSDLATDATGAVYAADAAGSRVIAFGPGGGALATHWFSGDGRPWRPAAIAWGSGDRIAVADPGRCEIWILAVVREGSP